MSEDEQRGYWYYRGRTPIFRVVKESEEASSQQSTDEFKSAQNLLAWHRYNVVVLEEQKENWPIEWPVEKQERLEEERDFVRHYENLLEQLGIDDTTSTG